MQLIAYVIDGHTLDIRPAPLEREWMDKSDQRYAYRCLPLNIANGHGWEILCPHGFSAIWNGGPGKDAVEVEIDPGGSAQVLSHFGHGVLTFHLPCLFRTDPGIDLYATGPINRPKDAIAALTGVIETDWAPYTFTMNWLFTQSDIFVRFEKGEPFCHIFPVARGSIEAVEPKLKKLSEEPELERQFKYWTQSRSNFNADLQKPGSAATVDRWQKMYFRGLEPDGEPADVEEHRSRLRVRPFT